MLNALASSVVVTTSRDFYELLKANLVPCSDSLEQSELSTSYADQVLNEMLNRKEGWNGPGWKAAVQGAVSQAYTIFLTLVNDDRIKLPHEFRMTKEGHVTMRWKYREVNMGPGVITSPGFISIYVEDMGKVSITHAKNVYNELPHVIQYAETPDTIDTSLGVPPKVYGNSSKDRLLAETLTYFLERIEKCDEEFLEAQTEMYMQSNFIKKLLWGMVFLVCTVMSCLMGIIYLRYKLDEALTTSLQG